MLCVAAICCGWLSGILPFGHKYSFFTAENEMVQIAVSIKANTVVLQVCFILSNLMFGYLLYCFGRVVFLLFHGSGLAVAYLTNAFHYIVATGARESMWQVYVGHWCVVKTVYLVASLAKEVHVQVLVFVVVGMAMAQFIPQSPVAIFYGVYQPVLSKQRQRTGNATLVHAQQVVLKVCHG